VMIARRRRTGSLNCPGDHLSYISEGGKIGDCVEFGY
jgi:hypothetical protein